MAITTQRVVGHQIVVSVVGSTAISDWKDLDSTVTDTTEDATSSDLTQDTVVPVTEKFEGSLSGFVSSGSNATTLPQKGDLITLAAAAGGSVTQDVTRFLNVRVTETNYKAGKGAAGWSFKFRSGVVGRIHGTDGS